MISRIAGIAAIVVLLGGCASQSTAPMDASADAGTSGRECFFLSQINGYHHVKGSRDRIHVSTGPSETYEFQVFGLCPYLDDAETMAFDQTGGGTICSGLDIDLIVPTPTGPQRCPVRMIRKLPPDAKG